MHNFNKLAAASLVAFSLAACDNLKTGAKTENKVSASAKTPDTAGRVCAANATYTRLKQSAFDEAKRIRERDTESLDALADASIVRMENPLLESRDEALGLTVCSGRMILELPPGAGAAFDGRQRLAADITYSAQAAADGSGTVFKIDGGEPIVYRLAGFDPNRGTTRIATADAPDGPAPEVVDEAEPEPEASPPVSSAETRSVDPATVRERRRVVAEDAAAARRADAPADDADARATRAAADARAARARRAAAAAAADARAARAAAIADARDARAAATERRARAERIAVARSDERGDPEPRATRSAARPSFNCRNARSRVEKQICGSSDLAARDRAMANVYYRANDRADGPTKRALSASRLRFLAYRDRCDSESCVAQAYEDRIAEINDIAAE